MASPQDSTSVPVDSMAETAIVVDDLDRDPPGGRATGSGQLPPERTRSGRYALAEEVGRGGMGRVIRARDQVLLREVALKVIHGDKAEDLQRFKSEARITGQLDHPHVLPVYDLGHDLEGRPFFTMKLVRGHQSLADVIDRLRAGDAAVSRHFTFERRVQVIQAVCHAMRYAHERGVVHRDVKPQNVVLGAFGEVYLVDWGVARVQAEAGPSIPGEGVDPGSVVVNPHEVSGTPAYMAPEQLLEAKTDANTDVYSLCAVLYKLLTLNYYLGHVDQGMVALGVALRDKLPEPAEDFRDPTQGRVPRTLSNICIKGLSKLRVERYQSAAELEEALQRWIEGSAPIVCPGTFMQRLFSRWSYLIDQRPFLVPMITVFVGATLLGLALNSLTRMLRLLLS